MAILCRSHSVMEACAVALKQRCMPHHVRKRTGSFNPGTDSIKVLTMHASKGLEFPVVALAGVGHMPEPEEAEADEARLFYVAATRATQTLFITLSGNGAFKDRFPA